MRDSTDEERFARLVEDARPKLKALLASYLVAPEDGEDLLQEAFLALWSKRLQVENPAAWLHSAVRMECLRYRRRKGRQMHVAVDESMLEVLERPNGSPESDLGLRQDLRSLVGNLPARHRALIHLRYDLGLTPEETARHLGYRLSSLKKTTTRCLQTLRSRLLCLGLDHRRRSPPRTGRATPPPSPCRPRW